MNQPVHSDETLVPFGWDKQYIRMGRPSQSHETSWDCICLMFNVLEKCAEEAYVFPFSFSINKQSRYSAKNEHQYGMNLEHTCSEECTKEKYDADYEMECVG